MNGHSNFRLVLTDNTALTEREFFKRELRLELSPSNPIEIKYENLSFSEPIMIASTNPYVWLPFLKSLPKESTVFFLLGNETYEPDLYESLNNLISIKHVFVYNPPTSIHPKTKFYSLIGDLIDQYPKYKSREIMGALRDNRISNHLKGKFADTNMEYSWSSLPQGYSNSFVHGLTELGLISKEDSSLTDKIVTQKLQNFQCKIRRYFLVGQRTNRRRESVIRILEKRSDSIVIIKETGFGGNVFDGDVSYAHLLSTSWFNIIPPGFFNNYNHRYTESCIVGAIPVVLSHNSIDTSLNSNWTNCLPNYQSHSFRLIMSYLSKLDEIDLVKLAMNIAENDFHAIQETREILNGL